MLSPLSRRIDRPVLPLVTARSGVPLTSEVPHHQRVRPARRHDGLRRLLESVARYHRSRAHPPPAQDPRLGHARPGALRHSCNNPLRPSTQLQHASQSWRVPLLSSFPQCLQYLGSEADWGFASAMYFRLFRLPRLRLVSLSVVDRCAEGFPRVGVSRKPDATFSAIRAMVSPHRGADSARCLARIVVGVPPNRTALLARLIRRSGRLAGAPDCFDRGMSCIEFVFLCCQRWHWG